MKKDLPTNPSRDYIIRHGVKSDYYDIGREVRSRGLKVTPVPGLQYGYKVNDYSLFTCEGYYICSCPDCVKLFDNREYYSNCKHIIALKKYLQAQVFNRLDTIPGNPVVLGPRTMNPEERLSDVVAQLKKRYKGYPVYWKGEIEADNPDLSFDSLNRLCKKVVGMSAFQYLTQIGIVKEIKEFDAVEKQIVSKADLTGKTVCFVCDYLKPSDEVLGMLSRAGATVVSHEAEKIDFVCFILEDCNHYGSRRRPILKDPEDSNKEAFLLMSQLETRERQFAIIDYSNLVQLRYKEKLEKCYSPEERAAIGLTVANEFEEVLPPATKIRIVKKISEDSFPTIADDEIYWTLSELEEYYDISGGNIPSDSTKTYSDDNQKNDLDAINSELEKYKLLCKNITHPDVAKHIVESAIKNKDGSLSLAAKDREQYVAAFKYTCKTTSYYAIVARNIDKQTIEVTQEKRWFRCYGDTDYGFDNKLEGKLKGVDPSWLQSVLYPNEILSQNPVLKYRGKPGYFFIDSPMGEVPEGSFANDPDIMFVELSDRIKVIGSRAFCNCPNLQCIRIGDNVLSIGASGFERCINLHSVALGKEVRVLGQDAFKNCESLETIVIPMAVKEIYFGCFSGCTKLKTVDFGTHSTCEIIRGRAFNGCESLREITLPDSLQFFGGKYYREEKFSGDGMFDTSIPPIVHGFVGSVADRYCYYCSVPFEPVYKNGKDTRKSKDGFIIDGDTLVEYFGIDRDVITIPSGISSIGYKVFCNLSITSIVIPEGVEVIEKSAFESCYKLERVVFPESLKSIGNRAFYLTGLTRIDIPDSVETIGESAFERCKNLEQVRLSKSLKSIGKCAFCLTGLTRIDIPDSVETIGESAFEYCHMLEQVRLSKSLKSIGKCAFFWTGLTKIDIPDSTETIIESVFNGCHKREKTIDEYEFFSDEYEFLGDEYEF